MIFGTPDANSVLNPRIELVNRNLWLRFHKKVNEMVVNRPGRKMFPKLELKISGLDPTRTYALMLKMNPVDNNRYKFSQGKWSPAGQDNVSESSANKTLHHEPWALGEFWMKNVIVFDRVKLTNRTNAQCSQIALISMHKYQPVVELYDYQLSSLPICSFSPEETQFVAVTAYQNQSIIDLKVQNNPFAKGFREGSGGSRKRSPAESRAFSSPPLNNVPKFTGQLNQNTPNMINGPSVFDFYSKSSMATTFPYINNGGAMNGQKQSLATINNPIGSYLSGMFPMTPTNTASPQNCATDLSSPQQQFSPLFNGYQPSNNIMQPQLNGTHSNNNNNNNNNIPMINGSNVGQQNNALATMHANIALLNNFQQNQCGNMNQMFAAVSQFSPPVVGGLSTSVSSSPFLAMMPQNLMPNMTSPPTTPTAYYNPLQMMMLGMQMQNGSVGNNSSMITATSTGKGGGATAVNGDSEKQMKMDIDDAASSSSSSSDDDSTDYISSDRKSSFNSV